MYFSGRQKWLPFEPLHLPSVWLWTNYLNFLGSSDIIHKHEDSAVQSYYYFWEDYIWEEFQNFSSQQNSCRNEIMYKTYAQKSNFGSKLKIKPFDKKSYGWITGLKF